MSIILTEPAPHFTLPDQDGKVHTLSDYKIYPKVNPIKHVKIILKDLEKSATL